MRFIEGRLGCFGGWKLAISNKDDFEENENCYYIIYTLMGHNGLTGEGKAMSRDSSLVFFLFSVLSIALWFVVNYTSLGKKSYFWGFSSMMISAERSIFAQRISRCMLTNTFLLVLYGSPLLVLLPCHGVQKSFEFQRFFELLKQLILYFLFTWSPEEKTDRLSQKRKQLNCAQKLIFMYPWGTGPSKVCTPIGFFFQTTHLCMSCVGLDPVSCGAPQLRLDSVSRTKRSARLAHARQGYFFLVYW